MKHFTTEIERTIVAPSSLLETKPFAPATMDAYLLENRGSFRPERTRPALIICPGGGYFFTSPREAEPIAVKFNSLGFHAFVLYYHTAPYEYPTALCELASAVRLIREHAKEWNIDPEQIAVAGFSAGGHLAANFCTSYPKDWLLGALNASAEDIAPNACVLCYPVITSGEFAHRGSFDNLLGTHTEEDRAKKYKQDLLELVSLEKQVTDAVPPTFLWHTYADDSVPVENSLLYAASLRSAGVLTELHIFPFGGHGLSLATEETSDKEGNQIQEDCAIWPELAARFLKQVL